MRIRFWYNNDRNTFTVKVYNEGSCDADRREEFTPDQFAQFCNCAQILGNKHEMKHADCDNCEL
jgi:hypothetical protein